MSPDIAVPALMVMLPAFLVFVHKHFRYKEKLLELQSKGGGPKLLAADSTASDQRLVELEERVQNLESIIVAMDSELAGLPGRAPRDEVRRLRGPAPVPALPPAAPSEPPK
jgi:hypothetical protein